MIKQRKNSRPLKWTGSGARFVREKASQMRFENQKPALRYKRARIYSAQLGRFVSRDPLGFVDGMSLYRGYFVPGGVDAFGLNSLPDDDWFIEVPGEGCFAKTFVNRSFWFWKPITCPPDRPIDWTVDFDDYNCAGLAFRDYSIWEGDDVRAHLLKNCHKVTKDKPCQEPGFCLKCVFYDIRAQQLLDHEGIQVKIERGSDFHIVCGLDEGRNSCSKSGKGPISGPGPIDSFPPKTSPHPNFIGWTYTPLFLEFHYCCPS